MKTHVKASGQKPNRPAEPDHELGDRIRLLRGARRQKELAAALDISQAHWSQIERGHKPNPTLDTLRRLASALGVSLAELVDPENAR
jgi:transcriptional regulator with XRE-family HTH domain